MRADLAFVRAIEDHLSELRSTTLSMVKSMSRDIGVSDDVTKLPRVTLIYEGSTRSADSCRRNERLVNIELVVYDTTNDSDAFSGLFAEIQKIGENPGLIASRMPTGTSCSEVSIEDNSQIQEKPLLWSDRLFLVASVSSNRES